MGPCVTGSAEADQDMMCLVRISIRMRSNLQNNLTGEVPTTPDVETSEEPYARIPEPF